MEINYKKKIEICKNLGAEKFQKVVFKVEEIKYKTMKKICPNFIKLYDKINERNKNKFLKKAKDEETRQKISDYYLKEKLLTRKEFYKEKNRNYHMDPNKPLEILSYLEENKNIHKRGLIINGITIPVLTGGSILLTPWLIPLLIYELGEAFINFQCINIQNYNIYRIKDNEEGLKKIYKKRVDSNIKKYGEVSKTIEKILEEKKDIPAQEEIIDSISDVEQLRQLKQLVEQEIKMNEAVNKQKKIGVYSGKNK